MFDMAAVKRAPAYRARIRRTLLGSVVTIAMLLSSQSVVVGVAAAEVEVAASVATQPPPAPSYVDGGDWGSLGR